METDKEILDLVNSIDFKQATWSEERDNTHVFDFGALTIRIKAYPITEGASIISIGDIPCAIPFENYEDFTVKQLDTWCVLEAPGNMIAAFTDSEASTAEHAAKEHADRMNNIYDTIYDKRNYKRCSESISATCTAVEWLQHWSDALFKKVHLNKYADSEPGYSVTGALIRMRESFKRVEEAINSMPSDEDVEKAVKEHKKI